MNNAALIIECDESNDKLEALMNSVSLKRETQCIHHKFSLMCYIKLTY